MHFASKCSKVSSFSGSEKALQQYAQYFSEHSFNIMFVAGGIIIQAAKRTHKAKKITRTASKKCLNNSGELLGHYSVKQGF